MLQDFQKLKHFPFKPIPYNWKVENWSHFQLLWHPFAISSFPRIMFPRLKLLQTFGWEQLMYTIIFFLKPDSLSTTAWLYKAYSWVRVVDSHRRHASTYLMEPPALYSWVWFMEPQKNFWILFYRDTCEVLLPHSAERSVKPECWWAPLESQTL